MKVCIRLRCGGRMVGQWTGGTYLVHGGGPLADDADVVLFIPYRS